MTIHEHIKKAANGGHLEELCIDLASQVEHLTEMVNNLTRARFMSKSEREIQAAMEAGQKTLFGDVIPLEVGSPEVVVDPPEEKKKEKAPKTKRNRYPLPEHLPREQIVLDAKHDRCDTCGSEKMKKISEKISEKLHITPPEFKVIEYIRPVYSCKCCESMKVENLPPHPAPKAGVTTATLALIANMKYMDGMPLYRISKSFERRGFGISRDKLAQWMALVGKALDPIVMRIDQLQRDGPILQLDETRFQVLAEEGRAAEKQSWMIVGVSETIDRQKVVRFRYSRSRDRKTIETILNGYQGAFVSDGLEVYNGVARSLSLEHAGCWAHARRKFFEASKSSVKGGLRSMTAQKFLKKINELFAIERNCKERQPKDILQARVEKSLPVLQECHEMLLHYHDTIPKESLTGKALHYLKNQWEKLTVFTLNGRIPIHNNACENAIRPFVVGRKSWLFSGSPRGAHASATIYSCLETAKCNGLDPYQWLSHVLETLPLRSSQDNIDDLLPLNI